MLRQFDIVPCHTHNLLHDDDPARPVATCLGRAPAGMRRALGTVEQGAVRFSFSYLNTDEEVELALAALRAIALDAEQD